MEQEAEAAVEDHPVKKGRHRKKLLYSSIVQQMEFYFSDSNLSKDRFLSHLLQQDPSVELSVFLQFNKLRKLTSNLDDIVKALGKSEILGLSEDKTKVFRKTPLSVKSNVDECTIYVEHIKSDTSHEWVSSVFSEFGKVAYVSIPKYRHNKLNKGFAFVEFEHPHEAQKALEYFDNIGCKMSVHMEPDQLCSIKTFNEENKIVGDVETKEKMEPEVSENENKEEEKKRNDNVQEKVKSDVEGDSSSSTKKRKRKESEGEQLEKKKHIETDDKLKSDSEEGVSSDLKKRKRKESENEHSEKKKVKRKKSLNIEDEKTEMSDVSKENIITKEAQELSGTEESEDKKRKKHKKIQKRKAYFKELGLQILSKDEWKKMRNRYLNNQRLKMKQLKVHLQKRRYQTTEDKGRNDNINEEMCEDNTDTKGQAKLLEFIPGVIVKATLPEPCYEMKKTKSEIKTYSSDIQYIDIPIPSGSEEVFIRFSDSENAKQFLNSNFNGTLTILEGEEEKQYWEKIHNNRKVKFTKDKKKQRGREKLLKRAERELGKHIRFDEAECEQE